MNQVHRNPRPEGGTVQLVDRKSRAVDDVPGTLAASDGSAKPASATAAVPVDVPDKRAKHLLSIVIPAYNEQDNVGQVFGRLSRP